MLKELYKNSVFDKLKEMFGYKNPMSIPKVNKIVVNMGVETAESKDIESGADVLAKITGQLPVIIKARQSISTFKLREGMPIGCKVTLRGERMYSFLEHLIYFGLPRTRDFRGLNPKSFDGRGNYCFGMKDSTVFPQIEYNAPGSNKGFDVCIHTSATKNQEAKALLELLGLPFIEN